MRRLILSTTALLLIGLFTAQWLAGSPIRVAAQDRTGPFGTPVYVPYIAVPLPPTPTFTPTITPTPTETATPSQTPTATPYGWLPDRIWDSRLDRRFAQLIPAQVQPGQGYWRLVKALWFGENEPPFAGQVSIQVDALDGGGHRQVSVPIRVTNLDDTIVWQVLHTEAKPGELYAASFRMAGLAPSYRAQPDDDRPADVMWGMGYGCMDQPQYACHTGYGLTWQWVVEPWPDGNATPTPTATATATGTATRTGGPTPTATPTARPTATPAPGLSWDSRLTQRGTQIIPAQAAPGQGYWRLVRGVWYDVNDPPFQGKNYVYVDLLDASGVRQTGQPVRFSSTNGATYFGTISTETKPGELYAASFVMNALAPAYRAQPSGSPPADIVYGMGLGNLQNPNQAILVSYGFTWRWTIAAGLSGDPAPGRRRLGFQED